VTVSGEQRDRKSQTSTKKQEVCRVRSFEFCRERINILRNAIPIEHEIHTGVTALSSPGATCFQDAAYPQLHKLYPLSKR